MANLKAKLICLLFKLKPAIKNNVDKRKYQKIKNSNAEPVWRCARWMSSISGTAAIPICVTGMTAGTVMSVCSCARERP